MRKCKNINWKETFAPLSFWSNIRQPIIYVHHVSRFKDINLPQWFPIALVAVLYYIVPNCLLCQIHKNRWCHSILQNRIKSISHWNVNLINLSICFQNKLKCISKINFKNLHYDIYARLIVHRLITFTILHNVNKKGNVYYSNHYVTFFFTHKVYLVIFSESQKFVKKSENVTLINDVISMIWKVSYRKYQTKIIYILVYLEVSKYTHDI